MSRRARLAPLSLGWESRAIFCARHSVAVPSPIIIKRNHLTDPAPYYDAAVSLLHSLSGPHGIRASESSHANYGAIFARDAVMAGIGGLLIEDRVITSGLVRTLAQLRDLQGAEGQIASNYALRDGEPPQVSFGTLVPRVDAALWYLIGVGLGARAGAIDASDHRDTVGRVVRLLDAIEYNGRNLLYAPVGGNWADEYIYDGYVLHDQALRAWGLRLVSATFGQPAWRTKADQIEEAIATSFWPANDDARRYPLAAFSPTRVHDVFDLATCALLATSGVASMLGARSLGFVSEEFLARGALPPAFHPVIDESHEHWPELARYHLHGFRNRPHEYHNGGVWMIWLGWLSLALARTNRDADLRTLRDVVDAHLRSLPDFAFEEYFHGRTGAPAGTKRMAYSATGIVFLHAAGAGRLALLDA
jgi:Alkaline and neutral invertase